jgi:hypothetical protein
MANISEKIKQEDLDKVIGKKVEEAIDSRIEEITKNKEEMAEKKAVLISNEVVKTLNKILAEEMKLMYLQGLFSLQCDMLEDEVGKKYYTWYSDDSKWNIKKINKYLKQSNADVEEKTIDFPIFSFGKYSKKEEVMEYMAEQLYDSMKLLNGYCFEIFNSKDVISYELAKSILVNRNYYYTELKECINNCSYKDKKVTITIEKDWYSNSINKVEISSNIGNEINYK